MRTARFAAAGNKTKTCRCGRVIKASNLERHRQTQACRDAIAALRAADDAEMLRDHGLVPAWPGSIFYVAPATARDTREQYEHDFPFKALA